MWGGAPFACDEIEERAEGAGEESEDDERPGGEAAQASVMDHPNAGEKREYDKVREDLGGSPALEVGGDDAPETDVPEGDGGEGAEGEDDGGESE